jgi:hypothetical protein
MAQQTVIAIANKITQIRAKMAAPPVIPRKTNEDIV